MIGYKSVSFFPFVKYTNLLEVAESIKRAHIVYPHSFGMVKRSPWISAPASIGRVELRVIGVFAGCL